VLSEPWLAIQNLARLNRIYEEGVREDESRRERGGGREEEEESRRERRGGRGRDEDSRRARGGGGEDEESGMEERKEGAGPRRRNRFGDVLLSQSVLSLPEEASSLPERRLTPGGSMPDVKKLPPCTASGARLRRNTLPSLSTPPPPPPPPPLHLPPIVDLQVPRSRSVVFLPRPPPSSSSSSARASPRPPPWPPAAARGARGHWVQQEEKSLI